MLTQRKITHGFPVDPNPLFRSNNFPTENRPDLHDQSMQVVIAQLSSILANAGVEVGDTETWPPRIKDDVAKWLSDWHLVSFLCIQGLFSLVSDVWARREGQRLMPVQEEQKILCRAATAHAHRADSAAVERLFASGGWQTLLTIVESYAAGEFW